MKRKTIKKATEMSLLFCTKMKGVSMSEGLKRHHHQYFEYDIKSHYDKNKKVMVRNVAYMCMICGRLKHETYEEYRPPPKCKKIKRKERRNGKAKMYYS
ncbi:hypothetical protein [Eggerthia catenaformis]|uniref:hypothetical protein n=1 Tax=Eggerthia catenaformis TaxID=31973 RepID=UPI003F9F4FED